MSRHLAALVAILRTSADFPIEFAAEKKPGWFSRVIGQAMHLLNDDDAPEEIKQRRENHLVELDGAADDLERLGREGVAAIFRRLYAEDAKSTLAAWRYYLDEGRTYEERRALQRQATLEAIEESKRRREAWESFVELVRSIGIKGLKAIIPAILAGL